MGALLASLIWLLFVVVPIHAAELTGHPRVIDADTLAFGAEKVRIEGIDAPESRQSCERANGERYPCGHVATDALRARIGDDPVTCQGDSRGKYGRLIGFCFFADGSDLNAWVVRQGHALAYRKYSTAYVEEENAAKADQIGLWQDRFVPPWQWRDGERLAPRNR